MLFTARRLPRPPTPARLFPSAGNGAAAEIRSQRVAAAAAAATALIVFNFPDRVSGRAREWKDFHADADRTSERRRPRPSLSPLSSPSRWLEDPGSDVEPPVTPLSSKMVSEEAASGGEAERAHPSC